MPELSPEQVKSITRHILRSWKFWGLLVLVVASAGLGVVALAQRIIDLRSAEYLNSLQQKATNQFAAISGQISNQIVAEFQQPRVRAAVDQVARAKAEELLTNSVWPSIEAFQLAVDQARSRLAISSNQLALLEYQTKNTNQKLTNSAAARNAPRPSTSAVAPKLVLMDHSVAMHGNNYVLTLNLKNPGGSPIGSLDLIAGTYKQTARIISFASLPPDQSQPPIFNSDADAAQLSYVASSGETTIALELSAPTIVRITGDALEGDLTLPVAADKIHLTP
jgi:hypothetical protein